MHRAGTSATTRVINLLGVPTARDLVPPASDNVRGFWEPNRLVEINNEFLNSVGSSSDDPLQLPHGWLETSSAAAAKVAIAKFIEAEFRDTEIFLLKDPRIARLLPLWLAALDDLDIEPFVVIPFRNPLQVAGSLRKRDRFSLSKALLLYQESYLQTELASRGRQRSFVNFEAMLGDWRVLDAKLRHGAIDLAATNETASLIEDYLSDELRHHREDRDTLINHPAVPRIIVRLYDALETAGADCESEKDLDSEFDRLRRFAGDAALLYQELLVAERVRMQQELKTFENSRSWKVTAPLRWVSSLLASGSQH
jgi:hypothetical protein